jgi:hypothetical protein
MKNRILARYRSLSRFEQFLLATVLITSLILVPLLIFFACAGNGFIQFIYEHRSLPFLNRLIQHQHPLEYYLSIKKETAIHLFLLWSLFSVFSVLILSSLYRFFFSDQKLYPAMIIFVCCTATALLFLYNFELRTTSVHTFFRAGPTYQIMNGNVPPMDPLFGGEILHYQWGYPWVAAVLSNLLMITPFTSFAIINVLSLAGCLWLLYKISNLLIDNPKINIFSSLFAIYCGTLIYTPTLLKLKGVIPFYGGENRVFPLLVKFHNNNGAPLGLVFFLLMVYGAMKLFDRKRAVFYSTLVLSGAIGSLFFYAAFGPGILAWAGFLGILWLAKYKDDDFKTFGRSLILLYALILLSLLAASPYLKQLSSSGGFLEVDFCSPKIALQNLFSFLLPSSLTLLIIVFFKKYLIGHLARQNASLLGCLFLSNLACYLLVHIPSNGEYKFLLLALVPFGIIGGVAFARIQHYSKWAALGLSVLVCLPSLKRCEYQFKSSPRNIFDIHYAAPYYESGTALESSDPEENAMYQWIRENTSTGCYFLDKETKIPVYAQRSLWVAFDTGEKLPGYAMTVPRMKMLHGYDDREFSRRQQVVQNIFGGENTMSDEDIAAYLRRHRLYVVVRGDNVRIPLGRYGFQQVFTSETGRFSVIASGTPGSPGF